MNERQSSIYVRVNEKEKNTIVNNATRCGLTLSEYLRQRALGYAPRPIPPGAFYDCLNKLNMLCSQFEGRISENTENDLRTLISNMLAQIILPGKDTLSPHTDILHYME